jgi:hypothetical protein
MTSKMFAWLLLHDCLNTKDMLQRRHWHVTEDSNCVLCPLRVHEDIIFECNSSQCIWSYLQIEWPRDDDLQTVMAAARRNFGKPFFMEVVIIV